MQNTFNQRLSSIVTVVLGFFLFAAPSLGAAKAKVSDTKIVAIESLVFAPTEITLKKGQSITWENRDLVPHTVTSLDGKFDSKTIDPNKKWTHEFKTAGSFKYKCNFHPTMLGQIKVE